MLMPISAGYANSFMGQSSANAYQRASTAFEVAFRGNPWRRLWNKLKRREERPLLDVAQVAPQGTLKAGRYAGLRSVPISQIVGSEGRMRDFSESFRPLQRHTKERWVSVAMARAHGLELPPVALLQIGEAYFVRDGHHRISVAKARGQDSIEAEVTVLVL